VHVYLEGDGAPYVARDRVAADPTPRRALALELFRADPAPALYLGRPCHYTVRDDAACTRAAWTDARYGDDVLASLHAALSSAGIGDRRVTLIGYSGGGVLAVLLAGRAAAQPPAAAAAGNAGHGPRGALEPTAPSGPAPVAPPVTPRIAGVVTIAANLDVGAWTRHHRYAPLTASADPALAPPLPASLPVVHIVGEHDANVPPALNAAYFARNATAQVWREPVDHACCWRERWPGLLARLAAVGPAAP
jgi:pimeloyl-ACP methyl ester carboxylesterase